jgi:hypothetical protein
MQEYDRQEAQALLGAYAPDQAPPGGDPTNKADAQSAIGSHQTITAAETAAKAKQTDTKSTS